jgi:hypothetical protein
MNNRSTPQVRSAALPEFSPYHSRWRLARDLGVFEAKLLVDGLKDIVLAPLALAAVVADMVMPEESRGVFLRAVIRLGERFERWLNLYGMRRRARTRSILDDGGSDLIIDYLENTARGLGKEIKDRRSGRAPDDEP